MNGSFLPYTENTDIIVSKEAVDSDDKGYITVIDKYSIL